MSTPLVCVPVPSPMYYHNPFLPCCSIILVFPSSKSSINSGGFGEGVFVTVGVSVDVHNGFVVFVTVGVGVFVGVPTIQRTKCITDHAGILNVKLFEFKVGAVLSVMFALVESKP